MSEEINLNILSILRLDQATGPTEASTPTSRSEGASTLSPSEQAAEDGKHPDAAFPWLPNPFQAPPVDQQLSIDIDNLIDQARHQSVSSMLDKWLESLEKLGDAKRAEEADKIRETLNRLFTSGTEGIVPSGGEATTAAAVTALLVIAASVIGGAPAISQPGLVTINELSAIAAALNIVPAHFISVLGLLGALFATAAYYPTLAQTLKDAKGDTSKIKDLQFASNYLAQVGRLILNPDFDALAKYTIIAQSPEAKGLDEAGQDKLIAIIKLVLLFTAIALYYKAETGHLTGQEIAGLVNGEIKLPEGDPRLPLVRIIKESFADIPESELARLLEEFFAYFDTNPSVEDLLEPNAILRGLSDNRVSDRVTQSGA